MPKYEITVRATVESDLSRSELENALVASVQDDQGNVANGDNSAFSVVDYHETAAVPAG